MRQHALMNKLMIEEALKVANITQAFFENIEKKVGKT
jgi:hypothetical protein